MEEDGERLYLGSPGWGWGLGWTLLGKSERSAQFWGGDPFGELGIHGGPWCEVTELGAPLTKRRRCSSLGGRQTGSAAGL